MCGIAGFSGRFRPELLGRMGEAIAHRGPDDAGEWQSRDAGVGLAHRRLAIIDPSPQGHQPMADATGVAVIVFNGEIYNFRELRAGLEQAGHRFRGQSDTEVLLTLYVVHGEAMLGMLNGIFAFAVYDKARGTLFLACDDMAVKPLYFSELGAGFIFGSELKALLACDELSTTLDVGAIFRTLGLLWSPGGRTPLCGVSRLGPGEALRVAGGRILKRWHWAASSWTGECPTSDADAIGQVRGALRTAVHRQMVADVPVGAFLSGGLDSSAVVALAREVAPDIQCFTVDAGSVRDSQAAEDLPYARRTARALGVQLHEIKLDASRMASDLERMVFQLDEPLADPAALNVLYISQLARQHGVKVLLSGLGGDDLFAGYRRHRALSLERYWSALPAPARSGLRQLTAQLGQGGLWNRRITKAFAHADRAPQSRLAHYFLWADPRRVIGLFAPEHRASLGDDAMLAPLTAYIGGLPHDLAPLQQMLALEQQFYLPDHNLLYTDKMSMAAGVEVRVPFLDRDLVRLANGLAPNLKQRGRNGKWVLRKAVEPYLPREVVRRSKAGFGAPLRQWLHHDLRDLVEELLSASTVARRGLFAPEAVTQLLADDRAGHVDATHTIFGLMCVEIWCRNVLDRRHVTA
jgi:asparagine synthase (glutamine-hydrolysing)